jgi:2-isopropylmalate synthase
VLKDRRTYEIMRPEEVGVPQTTLVLGKHSGRHALARRCEQLGFTMSRFELDRTYRKMVALADRQKTVSDAEITLIVDEVRAEDAARGRRDGEAEAAAVLVAEGHPLPAERGYGHGV